MNGRTTRVQCRRGSLSRAVRPVWPVDETENANEDGRGLCASQNDARSSDFRRRGMNSGGRRESTVLRGVLWAAAARLG